MYTDIDSFLFGSKVQTTASVAGCWVNRIDALVLIAEDLCLLYGTGLRMLRRQS